uniref:RWD domain-containing protein n=1 Tax=Panagrellus redivivus TaxID=6233 RepID=A0A7E4VKQ8_PANRE
MVNYEESYSLTKLQMFLSEHFESVPYEEIFEEGDCLPQSDHPSQCLHITINFDEVYLNISKISEAEIALREKKRSIALRCIYI